MTPEELEAVGLRDDDKTLIEWLWFHGGADDGRRAWIRRGLNWSLFGVLSGLKRLCRLELAVFDKSSRSWVLTDRGAASFDALHRGHHATRIAGELERIEG